MSSINITNVEELLEYSNNCFEKIMRKHIVIILNSQKNLAPSPTLEFEHANSIELFTDTEYQEIVEAFDELKVKYSIYYEELSFMTDVLNGNLIPADIVVFNFARNGIKEGKKSLIPSFCDLLNIIYTGSGAFAQSLCRNKFVYNKLLQQIGLKMPKTCGYTPQGKWMGGLEPHDLDKVIIKPIAESGSIGVSKEIVHYNSLNKNDINFIHNQTMLFQEYIIGKEVECPFFVINGNVIALPAIELKIKNQSFLDIETSANNDYTFSIFNTEKAVQLYPLLDKIVSTLNINGYGRADFRVTKDGEMFLFDVATMPFICKHSSFAFAMEYLNLKRSDIFKIILCIALHNKV